MTVETTDSRAQYATNATTGPWTVPFYFLADDHLEVIYTDSAGNETTLTLTTDYSVTGAGDPTGGTVTTVTAYAAGGYITVLRSIEPLQQTDWVDGDASPAASYERAVDLLTMLVQQQTEVLNRALVFAPSDTAGSALPAVAARANKMLGFNSLGQITMSVPADGTAASLALNLADTAAAANGANLLAYNPALAYTLGVGRHLNYTFGRTAGEIAAGVTPTNYAYFPGDVRRYGGVMDTSTAGVRTANSAALLTARSTGERTTIPVGTYWIDPGTALTGFWHIEGAGANLTFIKGDGDLLSMATSDNGEMRRIAHLTILNDVTRGKLFKNVGTTNRVEFDHVNFGKATYHIHSSGGDAVSWKLSDCRFIDASVESRHYEGLWAYQEIAGYTWYSTIGLRCTNGNVSTVDIDGTFEQMDSSAIVLDASNAAFEVAAVNIHAHFEVNGKLTNLADVQILTSAATRARAIKLFGCGFFTPTATQTVRVSVTAGGGGNIDFIEIDGGALMGAVPLCTNASAVKVRNVYYQSLSTPTGVTTPVQVIQSFNGKYLGSESVVGVSAGSSATVATSSVMPAATKMALISVQGNIYNAGANTHTGYLEARYFASGSRIAALTDVNNGAGANQGFVATVVGGAIQIANKAAMTNNQSGDLVISYWG